MGRYTFAEMAKDLLEIRDAGRAMKTRIVALENALKPFAMAADAFDEAISPAPHRNEHCVYSWQGVTFGLREIFVGDFRRARDLLDKATP